MRFRKNGKIREHTLWDLGEGLEWNLSGAIPTLDVLMSGAPVASGAPYVLAHSNDVLDGDWRVLSADYPLKMVDEGPEQLLRVAFDTSSALAGQFLGFDGDDVDWFFPSGEGFSGSGAPIDASYLVVSHNTALTHERVLNGRNLIAVDDDGPNSTFWVQIDTTGAVSGDRVSFDGVDVVWSGDAPGESGPHAPTHEAGGDDPIQLDDLAAPDDNTDLDATASAHGLLKKLGTAGQRLKSNGTTQEWVSEQPEIPFIIGGAGSVISTGICGDIVLPQGGGTITGWTLLADQSGSITIDTWKDTYANYPPTVADTMWGTKPALSSQLKNQATGLSIAFAGGDIIRYNVDSAATVTRVTLSFTYTKS